MRTASRLLALLFKLDRVCARFVESHLCIPVSVAVLVSAGMIIAKGIALMSPAWLTMGALAALMMSAVLAIGNPRHAQAKRQEEAARARYESRRASIRAMARRAEPGHTRSTESRYAMAYKAATETKKKSE